MYCRRLKSGKWSCTADATPDPLTGKRRQVTRRGDTKKEAANRTRLAADDLSRQRKPKKKLVKEVYDEWLEVYAELVKPGSVRVRRVSLKLFLDRHGNHFIGKLLMNDIQNFLIDRRDQGASRNYLQTIRASLNLLFEYALKNEYIEKNIVKDTVIPKVSKDSQSLASLPKKYLERKDVQDFLMGVRTSGRRNAYSIALTMLSTGLRIGEVLSLTWNDIDMEKQEMNVNKTLFELDKEDGGGFSFIEPKTEQANRIVSFNDDLAKEFQKMKVQYNKERLIGTREPKSPWRDLVFTGINSQPVRAVTIGAVFNAIYKAYGIEGAKGTHILRHTHITMLVEAGVDLPVIMERVGHSNMNVTIEIYTHVTQKMQERSNRDFNEYFRQFI